MRILIFGATGRVGAAAVDRALEVGHDVVAFVRKPASYVKTHERLRVIEGDIYRPDTIANALDAGIDAALVAVGGDVFKPSTLVTDSVRAIVPALARAGVSRYVGITGVAQMPATAMGRFAQLLLANSPIKYSVRDHQGAYEVVAASSLAYALAGCPYIKDGPARGAFRTVRGKFPGGFHIIHPGDVGRFLVDALADERDARTIVGIWY